MRINHNIAALNTYRQLNAGNAAAAKAMEKLSSGLRINRAGDDAAGLAISEKMRGQIRGLDQAARNAQDAISMIQTAEGALNETHSILQRMRELAVQAGNDTNTDTDRAEIQKEINQLTSEINRIGNTTEFNNQKLLNATAGEVTPASGGAAPKLVSVGGFTFAFTEGSELNGWTIETRTTANNTPAAAALNITDKKILIDGDFVGSSGMVSASGLEAAINQALSGAGFSQRVASVTGTASSGTSAGAESSGIDGGADPVKAAFSSFTMQVGANENQTMTLDFVDMRAKALGITGTAGDSGFTKSSGVTNGTDNNPVEAALDVSNSINAGNAVTRIQEAINKVSAERSKLGAYQNRLEHTINNLGTASENLTAAESRIRDIDMAKEMMEFTKSSILLQAAQAMLAQANQQPQGVLQLLR